MQAYLGFSFSLIVFVLGLVPGLGFAPCCVLAQETSAQWYRGNIHTHSLWSDGNDFPEMITDWYVEHGYHFLGISDHNILARGEKWISLEAIARRGGDATLERYRARFGPDWVETRQQDGKTEVRLKRFEEYRVLFEKPERFLLLEAEEITDHFQNMPIHLNATNLQELIRPQGGESVRDTLARNLRAVLEQSARTRRPILAHVNHPNYGYAITVEDLAAVAEARFFEVYNGHPGVNHLGNEQHPGVERLWDIANTLRLVEFQQPPLFGVATDDSHTYFQKYNSPGRGWVWVRAPKLDAQEILRAMFQGNFYASSGVKLANVQYQPQERTLVVSVEPEEGIEYTIEFVGTSKNVMRHGESLGGSDGQRQSAGKGNDANERGQEGGAESSSNVDKNSKEIGKVFARVSATTASYRLSGDELYVRAVVTSSKPHPNPSFSGQREQAWTQPVGWSLNPRRSESPR